MRNAQGDLFERVNSLPIAANRCPEVGKRREAISSNSTDSSMITEMPESGSDSGAERNDLIELGTASRFPPYGGGKLGSDQSPLSPISSLSAAGNGGPSGARYFPSEQRDLKADPNPPEPRPYQVAAIAAVEEQWRSGVCRTLLVLPTGTGKTVVFAELARRGVAAGECWLILAHRTELLTQAIAKLAAVGLRASLDKGSDRSSLTARVVVASVQTLRGKRLERYAMDHFTHVVIDEGHHAPATSYQNILARFPKARVLGVTATPARVDGKALGKSFDAVAFTYEMRTAIREKYLAPLRARRVMVADVDLTAIKSHHGDFDQTELGAIMAAEKALHAVVGPLLSLAGSRKTLVFGVDVKHAKGLAEVINRHKPGSAIALDGTASDAERAAVLGLFRAGKIQFLVNCALFTEGFDEPSIECVAMVRPTQSWGLYVQMLGRGTRPSPETGKTECLILDFVGNSKHRLIGPVDALAGHELDATEAECVGDLDGQLELDDVLAAVELEVQAKRTRASLAVVNLFRTKEIDPFLGDFMPPIDPESAIGRRPATEKQLAALDEHGIAKPPPGLTLGEASQMLDAIAARAAAGLASIKQARLLERIGIDTKTMSRGRAQQLITKLAALPMATRFKPFRVMHEPEFRRSGKKN